MIWWVISGSNLNMIVAQSRILQAMDMIKIKR